MTVGLLVIATGKYDVFVEPLIESVKAHFFNGFNVVIHLFTDHNEHGVLFSNNRVGIKVIDIDHLPFPYPTLYRYKHFTDNGDTLNQCDYLYYIDVDMLFVDDVGIECLPDDMGLTVTRHPGFYEGGYGSPNTDVRSTAFVPEDMRTNYYCGGFNGGTSFAFLEMANTLKVNIEIDEGAGVMAEWHDESHLNWYFNILLRHLSPKVLSPSYCFPEADWAKDLPFAKKIVALDKDHKAIRS